MRTDTLAGIRRRALATLIPAPRLNLAAWIEEHLRLPEGVSAVPGRVTLWAPQREIADAIGDPEIERVTLVKPVRVGFTTLLTGAIAAFVANEPAPILALLPTEADARDYVVSDVEPIFEATPAVANMLAADTREGVRNTLLSRRFPGGSLKVVAAKAPRNLRRHNVRVLFVDEADAMEAGKEGSSIRLAERRTLSFANRKIVIGSTPIFEDVSNVLRSYAASDQRVFEMPCVACGSFTEIQWGHIEWQPDKPDTAAFRCPHCRELIAERHKVEMLDGARWRATAPHVRGHAGFRLNALVSTLANASWGKLAAEFLAAKEDPAELQTFTNTILAQGWREGGHELDETALAARVEPFGLDNIPQEVMAVTAGADVQDDRIEVSFLGWTREHAVLILGHVIVWGSPDDDTTWAEVDELTRSRWQHPWGGQLKLDAMIVDSGDGDWTERVYSFCFPRLQRRIMAGKGMGGSRPVLQVSKGKVKGGRLFIVGVDVVKTTLLSRIERNSTGIRFSDTLEPVWFEQIASERRVVRYSRGQPVRRFERKAGARAEALDCVVYGYAARQGVQINAQNREIALKCAEKPISAPKVLKSQFMHR